MAQRGLRERKKAAAMHRIQSAALELFSTDGYDNVTIEQIADYTVATQGFIPGPFRDIFGGRGNIIFSNGNLSS